jgi:hypothetical protein
MAQSFGDFGEHGQAGVAGNPMINGGERRSP